MKSEFLLSFALLTILPLGCYGFAQGDPLILGNQSDQSLGEVAKHKSTTAHAKRVLTDEDPEFHRLAIPQILFDKASNSGDIVKAILNFSATHNAAETESTVKDWYQDEMDQVAHARSEISRAASISKGPVIDNPDDYEKSMQQYREQAASERQRVANRTQVVRSRNDTIRQIHEGLCQVRAEITKHGMNYRWFDTGFPYVTYYGPAE
jgi:hypothetical protein